MAPIDSFGRGQAYYEGLPRNYRERMREMEQERIQQAEEQRLTLLDRMCNDPKPIYYVVKGNSETQLQQRVQQLLERGMWQLRGGITYYKDGYGDHFLQAMYKPATPVEPENHLGEVEFRL